MVQPVMDIVAAELGRSVGPAVAAVATVIRQRHAKAAVAVLFYGSGLRQLEGDLAFWVKEKSFSPQEIAAHFHERIETIHPFANGNGRFGRIIVEHFCAKKGWTVPTWGSVAKDNPKERRKSYIAAIDAARRTQNYAKLVAFMYS